MAVVIRLIMSVVFLAAGVAGGSAHRDLVTPASPALAFATASGPYKITFNRRAGAVLVHRGYAGLTIRELPGGRSLNLLADVSSIHRSGSRWMLKGSTRWAHFMVQIGIPHSTPGMIEITAVVKPIRSAPFTSNSRADVQLLHSASKDLTEYAAAPPIAGSSVYLGDRGIDSTILYLSDYTSLGQYFDRTHSGVTQPNFSYPGAGQKGALVGRIGPTFGYTPPPNSLASLPIGRSTTVTHSFLYLQPGLPPNETAEADTYLRMLDTIYRSLPKPSIPVSDWHSYAAAATQELAKPANLVTVGGHQYLKSYVSDSRAAPELITQAGVLVGLRAFEARYRVSIPLADTLDQDLATFYDPIYHTVTNNLPHDPHATGESWYAVDNLISLLQLAQHGDVAARQLLLNSVETLITLAHTNNYSFPQVFRYGSSQPSQASPEPDTAGGYAWLMLGLYDLTSNARYLSEAKTSIAHVSGLHFHLSYETHMTAYTAAAAERLYRMTGDPSYHGYALLALANLFHATRLWDCTYGLCRKGRGYHTYMGLNPLPWSDYTAMLEQYEAWLALRSYQKYATGEPSYLTDLVRAFVAYTPRVLQYTLPPNLPPGAATDVAGEYPFVPHNVLTWYIPLEDLRTGEVTSGIIGQEIYGAGGVFIFAADAVGKSAPFSGATTAAPYHPAHLCRDRPALLGTGSAVIHSGKRIGGGARVRCTTFPRAASSRPRAISSRSATGRGGRSGK